METNMQKRGKPSVNAIESRRQKLQENLARIVQTLITNYDPESIILFGSMCTGEIHEWSDLDIVVIKKTQKGFYERLREVARMCETDVGVQYLVYTPEEFERMRMEGYFFINEEIVNKGKILYERTRRVA